MNKKQKKALTRLVIVVLALLVGYLGSDRLNLEQWVKGPTTSSSQEQTSQATKQLASSVAQKPLSFQNKRQLVLADTDTLGRAVDAHIQLKDSQEPKVKREALNYNPVGWHNYNFYYKKSDGSVGKMWLMARGHLVGYQFSGLNDEPRNLVPETAWFNGGSFTGMNDGNTASMLYYENRLDSWLANHPNYYLDVGFDQKGQPLTIKLGGGREKTGHDGATVVVLDNVAPNANINYADGTATNTVKAH